MENKLVTIERVTEVLPIKGADKIENIKLGDWSVVSQKDNYKINDLVIMIRPDALLPCALSEKYGVTEFLKKGSRVRVVKLKGCYSECLLLPIVEVYDKTRLYKEGDEISELLGITKYEEPTKEQSLPKLPRVYFIPSKIYSYKMWKSYLNYLYHKLTDKKPVSKKNNNFSKYQKFENKKNVPDLFKDGEEVVITEKIHGTNFRCGVVLKTKINLLDKIKLLLKLKVNTHEFVYGSHNVQLGNGKTGYYGDDYYGEAVKYYDLERRLWNYHNQTGNSIVVYGEIFGPGVQKGYEYGLNVRHLALFDIMEEGEYLNDIMYQVRLKQLNIPFEGPATKNLESVPKMAKSVYSKELLDRSTDGVSMIDNKTVREGCIVKSLDRKKVYKSVSSAYKMKQDKENLTDFH